MCKLFNEFMRFVAFLNQKNLRAFYFQLISAKYPAACSDGLANDCTISPTKHRYLANMDTGAWFLLAVLFFHADLAFFGFAATVTDFFFFAIFAFFNPVAQRHAA